MTPEQVIQAFVPSMQHTVQIIVKTIVQTMMGRLLQMAQQQHSQGYPILRVFAEGRGRGESSGKGIWKGRTGGRRPLTFPGESQKYQEWKMNMWAYLRVDVGTGGRLARMDPNPEGRNG